jgi:A/G-specific adenine glycosylase
MSIVARGARSRERSTRILSPRATAFRNRLLRWYDRHRRDLPWRRSRDPYAILVSEIMLQQTQVSRVRDFYVRFLGRYPTLEDLAAARPAQVRDAWSGLGYYARARNLHAAAREVVRRHDGALPRDVDALTRLPGIGRYTAAAVASIAFGADVGTVDTNVARVLARAFRLPGRRGSGPRARALWRTVQRLVPPGRAGDWNQALMDLGSSCCTATNPSCDACPVERWCEDPTVYEPPPRQTSFDGSHRQLRGALVRASVERRSLEEAGRVLGRSAAEIHDTIEELINEGLIEPDIELKAEG